MLVRRMLGAAACCQPRSRQAPWADAGPPFPPPPHRRRNPNERPKVAVNAQHYAILVTDVTQWPYPEVQR